MNRLKEILERIGAIRSELDELETADVSDETSERFTTLMTEFDELNTERQELEDRAARIEEVRAIASNPLNASRIEAGVAPAFVGAAAAPYGMDNVRKINTLPNTEARKVAYDSVRADTELPEIDKQQVRKLIDKDDSGTFARHWVAAASDEYRSAWAKTITGNEHALTGDEREALTAVRAASLSGSAGGYAVPAPVDPTIISTKAAALSPLREISTVKTITNDKWRGVSSAGVTATFQAEAAEVTDAAPTLADPSVTMRMARAFVPASIEITQDWAGIASDLADMFAEAKADLEAVKYVTGASGSNEPDGVVTAVLAAGTFSIVDTTTGVAFGVPDIYKLQGALPVRHRARASWAANNAIISAIRQFGTSVSHTFTTDLTGTVPQLMGRPLYELSAMDGAAGTDNEPLLFGDFSKFYIVDRVGLEVEYIPHLFSDTTTLPSGQRGWFAYWRNGSNVVDTNAFRILQS